MSGTCLSLAEGWGEWQSNRHAAKLAVPDQLQKAAEHLLKTETWNLVARLGSGAFEQSWRGGSMSHFSSLRPMPNPLLTRCCVAWMPARRARSRKKRRCCGKLKWWRVEQAGQLENPDARVILGDMAAFHYLNTIADLFMAFVQQTISDYDLCFGSLATFEEYDWDHFKARL